MVGIAQANVVHDVDEKSHRETILGLPFDRMTIVPLGEAMQGRAAAIFAAAHPHRTAEFAAATTLGARRWAAVDGDVVGYAASWRVNGEKYRIDIVVDEAHRKRGFGGKLLDHVIAASANVRSLQARPVAADAIAFLEKRGFTETMRMHHLVLKLAEARQGDLLQLMDRLAGDGIAIVTLADFSARSKNALAEYIDVVEAARDGWPEPDPDLPGESPTPVDWAAVVRLADNTHALVAEQRGRLVGFTSGLGTGVRPDMRGRGIATALKIAAIDAAIARGETTMKSATGHPAMRHINTKLGFREELCEVRMVRRIRSALP